MLASHYEHETFESLWDIVDSYFENPKKTVPPMGAEGEKIMQNQLSEQEIENIQRIKLFSVIEYLEQQIEFIATNYKDVYAAYQQSKISQPKIVKHEQESA